MCLSFPFLFSARVRRSARMLCCLARSSAIRASTAVVSSFLSPEAPARTRDTRRSLRATSSTPQRTASESDAAGTFEPKQYWFPLPVESSAKIHQLEAHLGASFTNSTATEIILNWHNAYINLFPSVTVPEVLCGEMSHFSARSLTKKVYGNQSLLLILTRFITSLFLPRHDIASSA